MKRILAVDDDVGLTDLLAEYLRADGFALEAVHDGKTAVEKILSGGYTLIVLDIMLPKLGGFDVLRTIRQSSHVPVIMLTARDSATDRILGLEIGADDYLPKPFEPRELVARVRSILRRVHPPTDQRFIALGDLTLDTGSRQVYQDSKLISLTSYEFDLLHNLLESAGQVVSRENLSRATLGRDFSPLDRSIDNLVSSLRKKLGPDRTGNERIKSIRSVGYQYGQTNNEHRTNSRF